MRKPTQPKAPRKPTKPSEPTKTIKIRRDIYVDNLDVGNGASLKDFINKVPEGFSVDDIFLYMNDDYEECYSFSCCGGCERSNSSLSIYYMEEENNPRYKSEMKTYNNKITKYNNKLKDFKSKVKDWKLKKANYLDELDHWTVEQTDKEIIKLEKELKRLKAS